MGNKVAPDAFIDGGLAYGQGSNYMTVCSGSPATFADAASTLVLAKAVMTTGCLVIADDATGILGRKLTMTAKPGVTIDANGFAEAVALIETTGSTLRYVTSCTGQSLVAAGSVDIPSLAA